MGVINKMKVSKKSVLSISSVDMGAEFLLGTKIIDRVKHRFKTMFLEGFTSNLVIGRSSFSSKLLQNCYDP